MNIHKSLLNAGGIVLLTGLLIVGAWAVDGTKSSQKVSPSDFDPNNENEIPDPANIDFDIDGITQPGQILMVEGLENETLVVSDGGSLEAGETRFPRLIVHGIFDEDLRLWRREIMDGNTRKRDIDIILRDNDGRRRLEIEIFNAWPATFTFPVLSADGSTRYLERIEFVYDEFEISD